MENKDTIAIGLALGAVAPVIGYMITEGVFDLLVNFHLVSEGGEGLLSSRTRTIALIAICFNLVPFNYAKNRRYDNMMRGIVFPTLIYIAYWLYTYAGVLF